MLKRVLQECLPTMFSLMMISLYGVIDGLFIGNHVGDMGLAAINIAWPIAAVITALGVGIGLGGSVLISYRRGDTQYARGNHIFHVTVTLLFLSAILVTALLLPCYGHVLTWLGATGETWEQAHQYCFLIICGGIFQIFGAGLVPILRNYQLSIYAMVCMLVGTIVNITVNYLTVCVWNFGIQGAALGTIVAQLSVSIVAILILTQKANVKIALVWDMPSIRRILKIAVTGFGISIAPSIVLIFTNWQCLAYGGDSAVACYCVIAYIAFPVQSILTGIGEGTQPLMSYYAGSKDKDTLHQVVKIARTLGIVLSLLLTGVILGITPHIARWFGLSAIGTTYFQIGMTIYASSFLLVALFKFDLCYLNACLKTTKATAFTYAESLLVSPLLLYALPNLWGVNGIWISFPISMGIMLLVCSLSQCASP